jgi:hypothetical protein
LHKIVNRFEASFHPVLGFDVRALSPPGHEHPIVTVSKSAVVTDLFVCASGNC